MILIKNGRLIDPKRKIDEVTDVVIKDGKIKSIGKIIKDELEENESIRVIDAKGCVVSPGLIDAHVHFRDPGYTYKEDLCTGAKSAAKGGFTTVVCMANTKPVVDNEETLKYVVEKAEELPIKVYQSSAITKGFGGLELVDMELLKSKGAVGFTDDGLPLMNSRIVFEAMKKAAELDVVLSFHEEDAGLISNPGVNSGMASLGLGLGGASRAAEDTMVARDCMLAIYTGAKVNIQHISSGVSVDMVRFAKNQGAKVYAEATPHHFTLTDAAIEKYGTNAKMNPPLRTEEDRLKIIKGLQDGTIDIIATDHAPHSQEEKNRSFVNSPSGIIGLETSLSLGIMSLVDRGYLTMMQLLEKMTTNPANLYGLDSGGIEVGKSADIVVFDPNKEWIAENFESKAINSPFKGWTLKGVVKYTICKGAIAYENKNC
ncbi:MAG: dihydroorotase [Clostridioides sp.]|nr:dihydroorotase [Clostridioides sp.]